MLILKVVFDTVEERYCFFLKLFSQHHVKEKTHKDRKDDPLKFPLELVKRLVDKAAHMVKRINIVGRPCTLHRRV